jgi:hypothetical protein
MPSLAELGVENISGYDHLGWKLAGAENVEFNVGASYVLKAGSTNIS